MNKVLLFAHLKEKAGSGILEIDAAGKSVGELRELLQAETSLDDLHGIMVAINEEFANDDQVIQERDEIALIPPVSGG